MRALIFILLISILGVYCSNSKSTDLASELGIGDPVITSIDPPSGAPPIGTSPGTSITINGRLFSATASNNTITFNGVSGTVLTATSTEITTVVPSGASSGTLFLSKSGSGPIVCDKNNSSSAMNCYGTPFYIDCYKSFNNQYGDEIGVTYPNSKTFAITGQTGTVALRIDLNTEGATNVKLGCDTYLVYSKFSKSCGRTDVGDPNNTATWIYQPTITFPSYYTVQMFVTAGKGNCEISFP
nr:IPT/TIG domain-containing protein [Leptospira semungkisensis]